MCHKSSKNMCRRCAALVLVQLSRNPFSKRYQHGLHPISIYQQFAKNPQKLKSLVALRNWGGAKTQRHQRKMGF